MAGRLVTPARVGQLFSRAHTRRWPERVLQRKSSEQGLAVSWVGTANARQPFTPPPYEQAGKQWTTGSIYYSTLVIAEAFGRTGTAEVVDLLQGVGDMYHPAYVVYEHGVPARVVLFNYISDPSGASTYNAVISLSDILKNTATPPTAEGPAPAPTPNTGPADPNAGAAANPGATDPNAGAAADPNADAADPNAGNAGGTPELNAGANTGAATDPNADTGVDPSTGAAPEADANAAKQPIKRTLKLTADRVYVRYLLASTVAEQYNITWAGQTMGYSFSSDGRLYAERKTEEYLCTDGVCVVPVPAPAIAVVFLTPEALNESTVPPEVTSTFQTTVIGSGTATIDTGAKATGNGFGPPRGVYGSTSRGKDKKKSGERAQVEFGLGLLALTVALWIARGV